METIGLDIGTTSICGVLFDTDGRLVRRAINRDNDSLLETVGADRFLQRAERIREIAEGIVKELAAGASVQAIGVTGQMHGILFLGKDLEAVSPLYTWKDGLGDQDFCRDVSYAQYLSGKTGYPIYSGYGCATLFALAQRKEIPKEAAIACTIADAVAWKLAKAKGEDWGLEASMAASLGAFYLGDEKGGGFDRASLTAAGVPVQYLPKVRRAGTVVGYWRGIPVLTACGDNQASFVAAVENPEEEICVNIGTGSQVSVFSTEYLPDCQLDCRPFFDRGYLYVGASLNGGKVYALLHEFFEAVCGAEGGGLYQKMEEWAQIAYEENMSKEKRLRVYPDFYGSRGRQSTGAVVGNMRPDNFTPGTLTLAWLEGMAAELYGMYQKLPQEIREEKKRIRASGNGLRRNKALQRAIEEIFGMPLQLSAFEEEAAAGAAMEAAKIFGCG